MKLSQMAPAACACSCLIGSSCVKVNKPRLAGDLKALDGHEFVLAVLCSALARFKSRESGTESRWRLNPTLPGRLELCLFAEVINWPQLLAVILMPDNTDIVLRLASRAGARKSPDPRKCILFLRQGVDRERPGCLDRIFRVPAARNKQREREGEKPHLQTGTNHPVNRRTSHDRRRHGR
jgi:hypothetical protein